MRERDPDLEPMTVASGEEPDRIVERPDRDLDPDELRVHRERLLRAQRLSRDDVDLRKPVKPPRAELAVAAIYTLYVVPVGVWVLGLGRSLGHLWAAAMIVAVASVFLALLWRTYVRSWKRTQRARVYEGVLVEKLSAAKGDVTPVAVFEGGKIELPARLHRALIPGVRYRVHAPETEDVAVDVAIDDEEPGARRSAYR
ncbi:MAG: hypothetical protein JST00_47320 [Deltaproteobacteria bacterium]|nr:hypothetical protein [Deltaproteobacteria bacterium]